MRALRLDGAIMHALNARVGVATVLATAVGRLPARGDSNPAEGHNWMIP